MKRGIVIVVFLSSVFLFGSIGFVFSVDMWIPYVPLIERIMYDYWKALNGTSFLRVRIEFSSTGYDVSDWGTPNIGVGNITADAQVWQWTGISMPIFTSLSHIYDLGVLPEGIPYSFGLQAWGVVVKRARIRPWDVNGDSYVGIDDLVGIAAKFGTYPGHLNWDTLYDVNEDGYVGIDDIVKAAEHFGQTV